MASILYVDYDKRFSGAVHDFWAPLGHECITVSHGALACESLREVGGDLAIVEVMMPDICGFEILRRIRADRKLFTTPVMLVSHMAAEEEIQHGLAQGADDYVFKPFDFEVLRTRAMPLLESSATIMQPDPLTHLMNERLAKCMVEHHISARRPFAVMCLELMQMVEFCHKAGVEASKALLLRAADILKDCGKLLHDEYFRPAHMGGGHFMCIVRPEMVAEYCNSVLNAWREQLPDFYASIGFVTKTTAMGRDAAGVNALVYYTVCTGQPRRSVHDCFQTLITMRAHARWNGEGIYADHRSTMAVTSH